MSSTSIAGIAWLAVVLAAYLWSRPRDAERAALVRAGAGSRLTLPFSSRWRRAVGGADAALVSALRRRMQVAWLTLALASLALAALLVFRAAPAEPPAPPEAAPAPQAAPPAQRPAEAPPAAAPPAVPEPAAETTPRTPLDELRTPTRLFGSANVRPVYDRYEVRGVEVRNVAPGSFWELIGVQSGDVVIELHGDPIDEPADMVALLHALEQDRLVRLRVRGTDGVVRYLEFQTPEAGAPSTTPESEKAAPHP